MPVKVKGGQTLADIAAQQCGQLDSLFDVAAANGMSITDDLIPGQIANDTGAVITDVVEWFAKYRLFPACGVNPDLTLQGGIDFMAIEFDFIVS